MHNNLEPSGNVTLSDDERDDELPKTSQRSKVEHWLASAGDVAKGNAIAELQETSSRSSSRNSAEQFNTLQYIRQSVHGK